MTKNCKGKCESCTCSEPKAEGAYLVEFEKLWREVAALGELTIQNRKDERGDYVRVRIKKHDGTVLECSAATMPRAFRAIRDFGDAYHIETWDITGTWRQMLGKSYSNETAAAKGQEELERRHPVMRFRIVKA